MNIGTSTKKFALIAGVLGVCSFGFLTSSASARPNREVKREVKEVRRTQTIVRTRPVVRTRTVVQKVPVYRNRTIIQKVPVYRDRTVVRTVPVYRNRTVIQNRTHRTTFRNPYSTRPSSYNGRVLSVSNGRLALNTGGNVYTVILASGLPRGINRGDYVRVVGVRNGGSIRNARVSIVRNN